MLIVAKHSIDYLWWLREGGRATFVLTYIVVIWCKTASTGELSPELFGSFKVAQTSRSDLLEVPVTDLECLSNQGLF